MKTLTLLALLLSFGSFNTGCEDDDVTPPTNTDRITEGIYNLQAVALANGADVTQAIGVTKVKYEANGTLTQTLSNGTSRAGSWAWLENEAKISITIPGLTPTTSTWTVLEITDRIFNKKSGDYSAFFGGDLQYNQTRE